MCLEITLSKLPPHPPSGQWVNRISLQFSRMIKKVCPQTLVAVGRKRGVYAVFKVVAAQHIEARQNGWHFPGDIFKCIFLNENVWIPNTIWLKFIPNSPIDNNTVLVQMMARRRTGAESLSELMMGSDRDAYMCHSDLSCLYERAMRHLVWDFLFGKDTTSCWECIVSGYDFISDTRG